MYRLENKIRLACYECDRKDFDGVVILPADWTNVKKFQSYEESIDTKNCKSIFDWYTHIGCCPDCQ